MRRRVTLPAMQRLSVQIAPDHSVTLPMWEEGVMLAEEDWQISGALRQDLMDWQQSWEELPYGSSTPDQEAVESEFVAQGHRLAARLQEELGDGYLVTVQPVVGPG